jgi:hypothetical protein
MPVNISRFVFGQRIITMAIGLSYCWPSFERPTDRLRKRDESAVTIPRPCNGVRFRKRGMICGNKSSSLGVAERLYKWVNSDPQNERSFLVSIAPK